MKRDFQKNTLREFLPAALSLEKTPASPVGRILIWFIAIIFGSALAWASLGEVDIVATAPGKIIPDGKSQPVQSQVAARVVAIHVQEGQSVVAGDNLLQLDDAEIMTAYSQTKQRYQQLEDDRTRYVKLLDMLATDRAYQLDETVKDSLLVNIWQLYQEKIESFKAEKKQLQLEYQRVQLEADKSRVILPMLRNKEANLKKLADKNLVALQQHLDQKQLGIEAEHDLKNHRARMKEIQAALEALEQRKKVFHNETEQQFREHYKNADEQLAALDQELEKQQLQLERYLLKAPVSGKVHQLQVSGSGSVVSPSKLLMMIVPEDRELEVETYIKNSDIGFVRKGQDVEIKIDAFPFTRYGLIKGKVQYLSNDAVENKNLGLVYKCLIALNQNYIDFQGNKLNLTPGMSVTAEVITGKRKLIEFFLSPLLRYGSESIRER